MPLSLNWQATARADLLEIIAYIADDNPDAAQALKNDIEAFAKEAPYFEDVRETMATLLQSGVASDLKTAYDKAIRLNDDVWQRYQAEAQQAKTQSNVEQKQQKAAEAKAKAVSVKSSSPTGMVNSGNGKKDLRSTVAELVNQSFTERV